MIAAQKFITQKMRQFEEIGGWEVANELAQHCTYQVRTPLLLIAFQNRFF